MLRRIAQLTIRPTLSLAPVRPFFFSTARSSALPEATDKPATAKKKLSHQAQSAIWAERVIQYILKANPLTDIHSYSLREQITKLQNPDNVHHFEPEPKEKVMRLFTQGIPINSVVFNQNKIQQAKQAFFKAQTEKRNFIFCPNLLVTKKIFQIMMAFTSNFLVTGGFGISKTVSIILFIQLSNHVNSYLFKAVENKQLRAELLYLKNLNPNPFFFDQDAKDKQLKYSKTKLSYKEAYFSTKIPRYWYWSIHPEGQVMQSQLKEILLQQAPQISLQKKNKLRSIEDFRQFVSQLKKCYPYYESYCMKVVVDQFNVISNLASQWNRKVDQYYQMPQKKQNKNQYDQNKKKLKLRALKLIQLWKSAICLSNVPIKAYVLNSTQLQIDLLNSGKDELPSKVYFDIQNRHGDFKIISIQYLKGLKGNLIDFLHNFWFQIERKLKIRNNDNIALEEMKRQFFEETKNKQSNYFSKFIFLREFLTQKKIQQIETNYERFRKGENGQNPFKGIYESFTEEVNMKYQQKVRQYFLMEKTKSSLTLFYALYDVAIIQSQTNDKDNELTASIQKLTRRLSWHPFKWINKVIYQELLPFTMSKDYKSLKFYWKPKQFAQTIRGALFEIQGYQTFKPHTHTYFSRYWSHQGFFLARCIIQSLKKGADATFQITQRKQFTTQKRELRFIIKYNHCTTFQSFNQAYAGNHDYKIVPKSEAETNNDVYKEKSKLPSNEAAEYIKSINQGKQQNEQFPVDLNLQDVYRIGTSTITKNLKNLFDMCDKYPDQFCIATPDNQQQFDPRSECIDFIIARKFQNQYQLFTFAVQLSSSTVKKQDTQAFFTQVLKRQTGSRNFRIEHIFLCRYFSSTQKHNKQLKFLLSPWKQITFKSTANPPALQAFQRIKEINELQKDLPK